MNRVFAVAIDHLSDPSSLNASCWSIEQVSRLHEGEAILAGRDEKCRLYPRSNCRILKSRSSRRQKPSEQIGTKDMA